jgi:hypothetical protein
MIVPAKASPKGEAGVSGFFLAKQLRAERGVVNRIFASWNRIGEWLRRLDAVRRTA